MSESLKVWVRNDKGQVFGPLAPSSVELLIDSGAITGRVQVSTDGERYVFPGRMPGLRMIFPRELWGDVVLAGDEADAQWSRVAMPAGLPGDEAGAGPGDASTVPGPPVLAAGGPPGGPVAPGPAFSAGPGTRAAAPVSSPSGVMRPPVSSPSGVMRPPVSSPSGVMRPPVSSPSGVVRAPAQASSPPGVPRPSGPAAPPTLTPAPTSARGVMPAAGSLKETSPQRLYFLAASAELTGALTLVLADRELTVHFRKGNPDFLDSTHPEDSLDTFLVAQGLVTQAQVAQAEAAKARFGGELLPALFGLGLLNPNAVFQHLGQRAGGLLARALTAEQGTFAFDEEELPAARAMPLGNRWAVYLEQLRRTSAPDVRRRLVAALELPVMKATGKVALTELKLTPQETRAYNRFDGARSLAQLVVEAAQEADVLLRTAWMLFPLDLVSFAAVAPRPSVVGAPAPRPVAAAGPPPAPSPAPAPPGSSPSAAQRAPGPAASPSRSPGTPSAVPGPPGSSPSTAPRAPGPAASPSRPPAAPSSVPGPPVGSVARGPGGPAVTSAVPGPPVAARPVASSPSAIEAEARQLAELLAQMKKQDYFQVLGVTRQADAGAVKIAYLKAARLYHPDTAPPGAPESLMKARADLFALVGEANRTLADPKLRQDYVAELDAGGDGSRIDVEKILKAEELFQRGAVLVRNRKYAEALAMLDEAIAHNPDEGEFYAWRGWARYLVATDKKVGLAEGQKDLQACLARNPNVAAAYYFLGFLAKSAGDKARATEHFKKCVVLDPKHLDAQRELRMMK